MDTGEIRQRMGRFGAFMVWPAATPIGEVLASAVEIEELGYGVIWCPEAPMLRESLVQAALILGATSRVIVATGITSVYSRDATAAYTGAAALCEAFPGRFLLGLGCSHAPSVEHRGHVYLPPVPAVRAYLDAMDHAEIEGVAPAPRLLAALRPRMLELAGTRTFGAHSFFVPAAHSSGARALLGHAPLLAVAHAVVLDDDDWSLARERARDHASSYLSLANYRENLRRLGYDAEELDPAAPSDRLLADLIASGPVEHVSSCLTAHLAAGADHVAVMPTGLDHREALMVLRTLAPTLMGSMVA